MASSDIVHYGFGAGQARFDNSNQVPIFRLNRVIRASQSRVDILGIEVAWRIAEASGAISSLVVNTEIAVWRAATEQKQPIANFLISPFNPDINAVPIGLELLMLERPAGIHSVDPSLLPTPFRAPVPDRSTQTSWRFPPGVMYAKQGQELWVQASQPTGGGFDVNAGGVVSMLSLSVIGIDYGVLDPSSTQQTRYRSLPKFDV